MDSGLSSPISLQSVTSRPATAAASCGDGRDRISHNTASGDTTTDHQSRSSARQGRRRPLASAACSSPKPIGSASRSALAAASLLAALGREKAAICALATASSFGPSVKKSSAFRAACSRTSAWSGTGSSPLERRDGRRRVGACLREAASARSGGSGSGRGVGVGRDSARAREEPRAPVRLVELREELAQALAAVVGALAEERRRLAHGAEFDNHLFDVGRDGQRPGPALELAQESECEGQLMS